MCELLGMVSNVEADLAFSFTGLALRGGRTGPHADGWGVSLFSGRFATTFLEPHPAFSSPLARFVRENPMRSRLAVAHVRKMTRGVAAIENTHPFSRVYDRRHVVFAHNGTLPNVRARRLERESAIGDTDSEHAFCVMLEVLQKRHGAEYPKDPVALGEELHALGNELGADGVFNFLWADGEHLFARCGDNLSAIVRRAPFGHATLVDADLTVRLEEQVDSTPDARMAVVATFPLTRDEAWEAATPGTLWVFRGGDLLATFR